MLPMIKSIYLRPSIPRLHQLLLCSQVWVGNYLGVWSHSPCQLFFQGPTVLKGFIKTWTAFFLHGNVFFPPSTMTFWRCFKECLWLILRSTLMWPHMFLRWSEAEFYQRQWYKIGNALKDTGSAFILLCNKTNTWCRNCSTICGS